jgi:hypothetical protein
MKRVENACAAYQRLFDASRLVVLSMHGDSGCPFSFSRDENVWVSLPVSEKILEDKWGAPLRRSKSRMFP